MLAGLPINEGTTPLEIGEMIKNLGISAFWWQQEETEFIPYHATISNLFRFSKTRSRD